MPQFTSIIKSCVIMGVFLIVGMNMYQSHPQIFSDVQSYVGSSGGHEQDIAKAMRDPLSDILGPYNENPLGLFCNQTQRVEGLIFACEDLNGGIGNVRNGVLDCVRHAIDAGASAFVVPEFASRNPNKLENLRFGHKPFDFFFDRQHFVSSLQSACPQMRIHNNMEELWNKPSTAYSLEIHSLSEANLVNGWVIPEPEKWRQRFDAWLHSSIDGLPVLKRMGAPSTETPVMVKVLNPLFHYPVNTVDRDLQKNFGRILAFPLEIRELSGRVLQGISRNFNLNLSAESISPEAFLGVHLRTESDAPKDWMTYETQTDIFNRQALELNLTRIFVASGSTSDVERFKSKAQEKGLLVFTKFDVVTGADNEQLRKYPFDLQALVDYEVLVRASKFIGIEDSSFSWCIAHKRHMLSEREKYLDDLGDHALEDEYSWVHGNGYRWGVLKRNVWP